MDMIHCMQIIMLIMLLQILATVVINDPQLRWRCHCFETSGICWLCFHTGMTTSTVLIWFFFLHFRQLGGLTEFTFKFYSSSKSTAVSGWRNGCRLYALFFLALNPKHQAKAKTQAKLREWGNRNTRKSNKNQRSEKELRPWYAKKK